MENIENPDFVANTTVLNQVDHPQSSSVFTISVIGIIFTFLFSLIGLIFSLSVLSKSEAALKDVDSNPGKYTEKSVKKLKDARSCAIASLIILGFIIVIAVLFAVTGVSGILI